MVSAEELAMARAWMRDAQDDALQAREDYLVGAIDEETYDRLRAVADNAKSNYQELAGNAALFGVRED